MPALRSDSQLQYIKGVGPQRAQWLASLGLHTIGELLEYFPFRHEFDSGEVDIADLEPGMTATVRGEVIHVGGRRPSLRAELDDGTGTVTLRWFNQPYGGQGLFRGATVIASGKVQLFNDLPELVQPRVQVFEPNAVLMSAQHGPRRVGVYRGNAQVKSALIRRTVLNVLSAGQLPIDEFLSDVLLKKHGFPTRPHAVRQMHMPTSDQELERARARLAYEELFLMELALGLRRHKRGTFQAGVKLQDTPEIDRRIRARFPFQLTAAQNDALREIVRDLQSGRPMTRLLQGDVGSGKTVVALYACLVAIAHGKQAAIMAPTEILAAQHFRNIEQYLADSRVRYVLLRGGMSKAQRADVLAAIERGEVDLVVGTQALIQKDVAFDQLALVIVDEQHKFGVLQRHTFRTKGPLPHYLVMTATPIPRTLALTVFGDLDVSIIRQSPPGRGRIITKIVTLAQWDTVMDYVRQRLEAGEQAYVVCPIIGGDATARRGKGKRKPVVAAEREEGAYVLHDDDAIGPGRGQAELTSVQDAYDRLTGGPWAGLDVGLLHGALPNAEKQAVVAAFAAGKLRAVVATTVVEVGVDVPNATIMVVDHAERYGLSQLHQLRGRIGRGAKDSLCVFIAHDRTGKAAERMQVMAETTDGFRIAEADLRLRGPGQLFGTKQHGLPELHVANIADDFGLLEKARADAFEIVRTDPTLARPEHVALLPSLRKMFGAKLALIDAA
jgi:ATP-dependent DNA helicase RecG